MSIKILIVEDENIVAAEIEHSLEDLGCVTIDIANSGMDAIAKASVTQPDIVLMDLNLKQQMSSIQAAKEIWNCFSIPVIFIRTNKNVSII